MHTNLVIASDIHTKWMFCWFMSTKFVIVMADMISTCNVFMSIDQMSILCCCNEFSLLKAFKNSTDIKIFHWVLKTLNCSYVRCTTTIVSNGKMPSLKTGTSNYFAQLELPGNELVVLVAYLYTSLTRFGSISSYFCFTN